MLDKSVKAAVCRSWNCFFSSRSCFISIYSFNINLAFLFIANLCS